MPLRRTADLSTCATFQAMVARLIAVALLFGCGGISAQETPQSYEVELLIFRLYRPTSSPENWTLATASRTPSSGGSEAETTITALPKESTALSDTGFPALAPNQLRLTGVAESLRKSKHYQPLAHFGWTQPSFPLGSAPRLSLQHYLPGFLPEGVALSGEVSLARGTRLLHLTLDLTYQAPDGMRYVLRETRRMRSTERHYLDHPYFGVIALVTPIN